MLTALVLTAIAALLPCSTTATKHSQSSLDHFLTHLERTIAQTNHALSRQPLSTKNQLERLDIQDEGDEVVPRSTKTVKMPLKPGYVGNGQPGPTPIVWYFAYTGKSSTGTGSGLQTWGYTSLDTANSYYNVHGPACPYTECGFFKWYNQNGTALGTNTTVFFGNSVESGEDYIDRVCVLGPGGVCVDNTTVVSDSTGTAIFNGESNLGLSFGIVTPPAVDNDPKDNIPEKASFLSGLMAAKSLTANEFSISYGGSPQFILGGSNASLYQAPLSTFPVMPIGPSNPGYWQLELDGLTGGSPNDSSNTLIDNTGGVVIMDSLSPSIVGPTAYFKTALQTITNRTGIKFDYAQVTTNSSQKNATLFLGKCHEISLWDMGFQFGNTSFPIPSSNLDIGRNADAVVEIAGPANGFKRDSSSLLQNQPEDLCLLGIAGYDFDVPHDNAEPVYVVGFPFMREWYSVYSFENGGTISFGKDIG